MRSYWPISVACSPSPRSLPKGRHAPPIAAVPDVMTLCTGLTMRNAMAVEKTPAAKSAAAKMIRNLSLLLIGDLLQRENSLVFSITNFRSRLCLTKADMPLRHPAWRGLIAALLRLEVAV